MQGSIAQVVGLTISGNALLAGVALDHFWPDASIFTFCRDVRFGAWDPERQQVHMFAEDPRTWLAQKRLDTAGFRVRVIPRNQAGIDDRMTVGFVGGGARWLIEAVGTQGRSQLWENQWEVSDRDAPDRRLWSVIYWQTREDLPPFSERPIDAVSADLAETLTVIADFADRCGSGFAANFRAGLSALRGEAASVWHKNLAPPGFVSPAAARLLDACQAAWVFGGMGSWNESPYGDDLKGEGDLLSDRLFGLLQEGLAGAANSTFPR